MAIAKSKTEQLRQIQGLLSTVTNSRQRVMYEGMLSKLKSQIKEEEEAKAKLEAELKAKLEIEAKAKLEAEVKAKVAIQEKSQTSVNHKSKKKLVLPTVNSKEVVSEITLTNETVERSLKSSKDSDEVNQSAGKKKKQDTKEQSKKIESPVSEKTGEKSVEPELRFLAKGVLEGEISLAEKGLAIAIDGQQYSLGYTFISRHRDYKKLQEELSSGSVASLRRRVAVYPEVKLVDKKYIYFFNLVAVGKETKQGIFAELEPGEFYLSGLWQHVQSHTVPCLSIYRNVTDNFLEIAAKHPLGKVRNWLKPIQVPVEGLDVTEAFKYDPQAKKNKQKRRKFYCLSAIFSNSKFVVKKSSILEYSQAPKYIKASQAAEILKNQHARGISSGNPSISAHQSRAN